MSIEKVTLYGCLLCGYMVNADDHECGDGLAVDRVGEFVRVDDVVAALESRATHAPIAPRSWSESDEPADWFGWNPDDAFRFGYQSALREFAAWQLSKENQ
jgi:hypothetical protein